MNSISRFIIAGTLEPSEAQSFARWLLEHKDELHSSTGGFLLGREQFLWLIEDLEDVTPALVAKLQGAVRLGSLELLHTSCAMTRQFESGSFAILRDNLLDEEMLKLFELLTHDGFGQDPTVFAASLVSRPFGAQRDADRQSGLDETMLRRELDALHRRATNDGEAPSPDDLVDFSREELAALDRVRGVLHLDLDGTIRRVNDLYLEMVSYAHCDLVGRNHRVLFTDEDRGRDADAFWTCLRTGRSASGDFKRRRKDGSTVWLRCIYSPLIAGPGQPVGIICHADDVTTEKLGQAEARSQVDAIHKSHAVVIFDMQGIILEANDLFLKASHYTREEIVGRHHRMFVDPAYQHGGEYAAFWRHLGEGLHQSGEFKRIAKGGQEIWLQATYNPIFDLDGQPIKVVKYATVVTEERLRQAQHQSQIAAIHKAQCVIAFDLSGIVLDANDNFLAATGYRLSEVRGKHHSMFVDADVADSEDYKVFWRNLAEGKHQSGEFRRIGKDGREIWLQATYNPIFNLSGRPYRVVKYASEVTGEKSRQVDFEGQIEAIRKSQCVITLDLDGTILDVNDKYLDVLDFTLEQLKGKSHGLITGESAGKEEGYQDFWRTIQSGEFVSGVFKNFGKGGRPVWVQASYNPILDLHGRPVKVIGYATDVTSNIALSAAFEDARQQAQHDPFTSLPNRARLSSYMSTALAQPGARLVVIFIDFDGFKPINDTYGHAAGDKVLSEFADRLRCVLSSDQLAARVGGDEFVVAAPDLTDDQIVSLCQQLILLVTEPIDYDGVKLHIGISMGIAVSPEDGTEPDELLRCADVALYRSKQKGGMTFCFHAEATNEKIVAYRTSAADIERGIAAGEFFLEYQPRFCGKTRNIKSVEALVRWQHPERGRVPPAEFITIAERSGAIVSLGEWVLETACKAATHWKAISVSVNISAVQFRKARMLAVVSSLLEKTGLEPHRLELEITESVLLDNVDDLSETLYELKRLGVTLAMDDFGTGYSSLSSLRNFPFDVIKIDRQFVADIGRRSGGRDVVRAIISLARALTLSVTAEGVETDEQASALVEDHCDELQGFLLSEPLPPNEVSRLIETAFVPVEDWKNAVIVSSVRKSCA